MAEATTESVFQHHMQALTSGNLDEVMKDYTEDSVLFTPAETYKGLEGIKAGFATVTTTFPPEAAANMKLTKQEIHGEYLYILWTMLPVISSAGDTFYIHDGKIMMQSVIFSVNK